MLSDAEEENSALEIGTAFCILWRHRVPHEQSMTANHS